MWKNYSYRFKLLYNFYVSSIEIFRISKHKAIFALHSVNLNKLHVFFPCTSKKTNEMAMTSLNPQRIVAIRLIYTYNDDFSILKHTLQRNICFICVVFYPAKYNGGIIWFCKTCVLKWMRRKYPRKPIFNSNACGHWNHTFMFSSAITVGI